MAELINLEKLLENGVGQYKVSELIGEGRFINAYRGHHREVEGRTVAVKIPKDRKDIWRLRQEAQIFAQVGGHQNIVEVYDFDMRGDYPHVVTEFCDSSVKQMLDSKGTYKWNDAVDTTMKVLDGLSFIHTKGIVHGNVKPSNILLKNGIPKLSDFNSRKHMTSEGNVNIGDMEADADPTDLDYCTPEHRKNQTLMPQSDIFQAGQLLYEMITNKKFKDSDDKVSSFGAPKWVEGIIEKATMKDATKRYRDATEMAGELRKGIEGKFDEPGAVEKLGKGVANAGKEAGHALGRVGGTLLTGLKYAGLGITIPLWGPAKLAGSIWDDWAPENQILAAVIFLGYYGGAIVGGGIANEKYHEAKTKKELAAVIEQAPENMHVGHISEDGKNYQTFNMKELLNDERTYRTIPITQPIENVLGTRQGRVLYVGTTKVEADEKLMDKIKDRTFSQIYSMDLTTGEVVAMIDYSQKGTREETNGQLFQETRMIENGENAPTFLVKMQEKWYQAREGGFVPQGAVEIPPQKNYAQIPGSDFVFNQDGFDENILQVEHEGQTFGDIELTRGKNPIVFMMAQDVLKTE